MNLESQVASLELSKRLKDLGVPQESLWYWQYIDGGRPWGIGQYLSYRNQQEYPQISAFTVAELGGMLPECYVTERRLDGQWECSQKAVEISEHTKHKVFPSNAVAIFENTEADSRAKMLIYLIENKLIDLGKLK